MLYRSIESLLMCDRLIKYEQLAELDKKHMCGYWELEAV